jgi:PKD domain
VIVKAASALAGLVAAVSVAAGCGGGGDRQLDVLQLENLASFVAPGGTIEAEPETSDDEVARVFAFDDTAASEAGRAAAIEAAKASGWTLTFDEGHPGDQIFGAKELATGDVRLVIGKYEEGDLVKISIRLEHGPCTRCKPGGQQASDQHSNQSDKAQHEQAPNQPQLPSDDSLSVPGTILVLPSAPNAWAGGPYVAKLGESVELDGTGSYDRDGRIVRYEWDVDGDGDFDVSTSSATVMHKFTRPVDGKIALRVTDDTGRTAVAKTYASASVDGDGVQAPADNCPNDANYGQGDWDEDGVGDVCDPTPFGG